MTNIAETLATSLKTLMTAQKVTIEKLSELSGVSVRTIGKLRRANVKDPSLSTVIALCDALHCSIDEVLNRDVCDIDETMMLKYHSLAERDKNIVDAVLGDKKGD